jgi:hypothetical protein
MNEKDERRAYWSGHVRDWQASGKTRSEYCRSHNLTAHQLTYWIKVVEPTLLPTEMAGKGFVAVQVSEPRVATAGLTIRLANGVRLEGVYAGNLNVIRELLGCLS